MAISALSSGMSGMQRASSRLEVSADRIARAGTGLGDVDRATELVNVMQAQHDFDAAAKVTRAASDMQKSAIDILA